MEQLERLEALISKNSIEKIQKMNICVVGIGGVGGYICEGLARCGITNISLIDNDTVSITNLNRQIIALHSTIGQYKTEVMKKRILDINPNCVIKTYNIFLDENTINDIDFTKFNYVADAIDSVTSKLLLIKHCKKNNINIISSMGTGNKIDPSKLLISDISKTNYCPLAKCIRTNLAKENISNLKVLYSTEQPSKSYIKQENKIIPSSIVTIPAIAGLMIANEIILDITKEDQ